MALGWGTDGVDEHCDDVDYAWRILATPNLDDRAVAAMHRGCSNDFLWTLTVMKLRLPGGSRENFKRLSQWV
jgi:hypothetical protein